MLVAVVDGVVAAPAAGVCLDFSVPAGGPCTSVGGVPFALMSTKISSPEFIPIPLLPDNEDLFALS